MARRRAAIRKRRTLISGDVDDDLEKMLNADSGDPGELTEFKIDVANSSDALNFVAWVR
jgi:hypothetical protein